MHAFKNLVFLILIMGLSSCSQFMTHRDYVAEMERDDSSFFNPRVDFPVVAGDTGRDWESTSDRKNRTPASVDEIQDNKSRRFLTQELRKLEGQQSDNALEQYEKNKHHFKTTSEKIYFLKLSQFERKDYLASRGFIKEESSPRQIFAMRDSNVASGMSKSQVMENWGQPNRVEVAGNPSYENERWLYSVNGATKYIYFESGVVRGWE
jgi:hypothetical protein